jgi:PEGA domain
MKSLRWSLLIGWLTIAAVLWAADSSWQDGRIVEVKTTANDRTTAWVVNTAIVKQESVCSISVHFKNRIVRGTYVLGKKQGPPPAEWVKHAPVRLQLAGDTMFLKSPAGEDYQLHVESSKTAPTMDPWTQEETAAQQPVREPQPPAKSLIGFDEPAPTTKPAEPVPVAGAPTQPSSEPSTPPAAAAPEPTTATVSVRSTPYLADLYVDGENVGYTPAKLKLSPGKHAFRCEKQGYKAWTKEISVTVGSELTLDATLDRK